MEVEYEEFQQVNDELSERIGDMLKAHKEQGTPIDLSVGTTRLPCTTSIYSSL